MPFTMSTSNKILSLIILALSFSLYLSVQNSKLNKEKIVTLTNANKTLTEQVTRLTVNIKQAATINANLNTTIAKQNTSLLTSQEVAKDLERKVRGHKNTIAKMQRSGTNFNLTNNNVTAEANIKYLIEAAEVLVNFDPGKTEE